MLRVLIADDEARVCQLIEVLARWSELGMTVVGMAHDGIEALRLVEEQQPDIVITDIRMPGYDGLELIARAKALKSDLSFIIISGYAHFEYAQSALKYGVSDYLLKPIEQDELMKTLRKLGAECEQRSLSQNRDLEQRKQNENDAGKLRSALMQQLSNGEIPAFVELCALNEAYHFHFEMGYLRTFVIHLVCKDQLAGEQALHIVWTRATQQLHERLNGLCSDVEIFVCGGQMLGLCGYAPQKSAQVRTAVRDALGALCSQSDFFVNMSFSAALGTEVQTPNELANSLQHAFDVLSERLLEGMGTLLESRPEGSGSEIGTLLSPFTTELHSAWETLNPEAGTKAVAELIKRLPSGSRLCGREYTQLVTRARDTFLSLKPMELDDHALLNAFTAAAANAQNTDELVLALTTLIRSELSLAAQGKQQELTRPIRIAKKLIREQYATSISLEQVAAQCGFNSSYFSTLFKKECGMGFLEYLCGVRMEASKALLRDTDLLITEVCERVGYSDIKYFTKTFKKYTSLKPGEYRKLYS